jgi:hypothetical protein
MNAEPRPIEIQETRNTPLIQEPANYKVCVDSFSIDTTQMPIFVARVSQIPGETNVDALMERIGLTTFTQLPTIAVEEPLLMESCWGGHKPTTVSVDNSNIHPQYYSIYSYDQYINMINDALTRAYAVFTLANPVLYPAGQEPFIRLDPQSGLFYLIMPAAAVNAICDTISAHVCHTTRQIS